MKKIIVLCTGNSCRSQMAEAYLRKFSNGKAEVFSAGIESHGLNPLAVEVMQEDGVDISNHTSNRIDELDNLKFDYVITVCDNAKESCPVFPALARTFHQNFPDPAKAQGIHEEKLEVFRSVRQMIKTYCKNFVEDNVLKLDY